MFDILIRNGRIIDGTGNPRYLADLAINGESIADIGKLTGAQAKVVIDAAGKVVTPGFIDTHVHGDLALISDPYHEPAIRQGVTTYIVGQDGVAMAPASPATLDYMRRYTAGFSGVHDIEGNWSTLGEYLDRLDRSSALNVACLVPNGNVRMEAMGLEMRPPRPDELSKMCKLVRAAMEQGAVGLSTGLDYIPSLYADTDELIALCKEIAPFGGVYVTHMRAYAGDHVMDSIDEVFRIGREAGVAVHISHFNTQSALTLPKIDEGLREGLDVTYDLYCYLFGNSILGMTALPPWVQEGGIDATMDRLAKDETRQKLRSTPYDPKAPLEKIQLSYITSETYRKHEGKTLGQAAADSGQDVLDFVCDVLLASKMAVGSITPHMHRDDSDIEAAIRHPVMMGGSDGIFNGSHPHPRGWGCFVRYLGYYVRDRQVWTLEQAVRKLSSHAANRYGLQDRGILRKGMKADVVVFNPDTITDHATIEKGNRLATGVDNVLVNGELVLHNGERTKALPGRALRGRG